MNDKDDPLAACEALGNRHSAIHVIVSPPRCGSTALARVFWEHPSVRFYCHEPFEVTYYDKQGLNAVFDKLAKPLDIQAVTSASANDADALVVKEMPYQVGDHFPLLASLATAPVVFLIRDPRLNIASRIAKKLETGDSPFFPLIETGWELIAEQIDYCRGEGISYALIDASDYRNDPTGVFPELFARFGLDFSTSMLSWQSCDDLEIDNLDGAHSHLYRRVLSSRGVQPAQEPIPELASFVEEKGVRKHVEKCLQIYAELRSDPQHIRVTTEVCP